MKSPLFRPVFFGSAETAIATIYEDWLLSPAGFVYTESATYSASAALTVSTGGSYFASLTLGTAAQITMAGTVIVQPSVSPDIYFPPNVLYKLGSVKPGRSWETLITGSPTGREQRRALRPSKWQTTLTVMCHSATTGIADDTVFATMKAFEDSIQGRFRSWWVFDPRQSSYQTTVDFVVAGGVITNVMPIIFPFRGGSLAVFSSQPLGGAGSATFDQLGPGGEWRLTAWGSPGVAPGTYPVVFAATDVRNAYKVRKTHDSDDWDFDWNDVKTPFEVAMEVQEVFG